MGCNQSKIDNEETVTRCKDRKLYMKDAVSARNAFAAAHSAYTMSLKNAGAALSDYSQGEVLSPDLSLPHPSVAPLPSPVPIADALPPPPPPLPNFPPAPLHRAASMPEFLVHKPDPIRSDPIMEEDEDDDEEDETDSTHDLKHRSSSRRGSRSGKEAEELAAPPPPSPPPTEREAPPPPPPDAKGMSSWDFFFPSMENVPGPNLAEVDEDRIERQEIERKIYEERSRKAKKVVENVDEEPSQNQMAEAAAAAAEVDDSVAESPPQQPLPADKATKKVKLPPTESKRGVKAPTNINLLQIFTALDDCFLKASESAHEVSKMLEANRLHYHSNFADNRGHIDHSARVMRVITWNRSFRGLPNADDDVDDFDSEEHETHATVLDKMLAWEKKLYDEVKAGEQMKLDYQKKVATLNKLKKRGANTERIEKVKAAVSHLHTRYIVDMQSMDSTVSEINRLRDEQLYPKLVALVDGMATMWETMKTHHETQSKIVISLKYIDISQSSKETTEHHHERTNELLIVVEGWHSYFQKLINHQKEYIKALNSWLKLNLIPIDNNLKEKVSSPQRPQNPLIQNLILVWYDYLGKLPDELASTAISNFSAVMATIVQYQQEELKLKYKCEETQKELKRKRRQFEDWYNKYMQKRSPADDMDPDKAHEAEQIAERQLVVETVKKKLEEEEAVYQRQCIQVREKSLTSLKTQLPELFRALSVFSKASSDMHRKLKAISQ